jgi:hypothetical protein
VAIKITNARMVCSYADGVHWKQSNGSHSMESIIAIDGDQRCRPQIIKNVIDQVNVMCLGFLLPLLMIQIFGLLNTRNKDPCCLEFQ